MQNIVERISHSIAHKRNVFGLDSINTIERIYLDFEGSNIPGFLELFSDYGYEDANKGSLELFESVEIGQKHLALNALYALGMAQGKYKAPNLTIYEKKPPFIKTNVGHLSIVLICSFIVASIYPIYALVTLGQLEQQELKLKADLSKMEQATKLLRTQLKDARKKRDSLRKDKNELISHISSFSMVLVHLRGLIAIL
jgi:hypothetical protein